MSRFLRISALLWADVLVAYALFVMQKYLTDVWKLSFTHAAGILNIWGGISMILPIFFLFLVDAILGNFMMLVLSSIAYSLGIGFIAMSTPPVLGTCKHDKPECIGHVQRALLYAGLVFVAVGIAGHLVSYKPFLEEQEDRESENCLANPLGFILVVLVPVIGAIAIPNIKPWSIRFGIPAICHLVATILFLTGWKKYDKKKPQGSPLTNVCRVFVASAHKRSQQFPLDANDHYNGKNDGKLQSFSKTRFLRCLERAAIKLPNEKELHETEINRWKLCSMAEVEEAKIVVRIIPMAITFIIWGIISSIGTTYFVEQANRMNPRLGKLKVPLPIFLLIVELAKNFFASVADIFLSKSKKYATTIGIAVAMIFSILCCITAARVETLRLRVIKKHGLLDKPDEKIPMSVFWLVFQFLLLAGLDKFFEKSVAAFAKDQGPKSMTNYVECFTKAVSGLGFMCSVLSVYVVGKISERGGKPNWFQYSLNKSRLDRYYWVLATLSSVNLLLFAFVAYMYRYKNPEAIDGPVADTQASDLPSGGNTEGNGHS